MRLKAVRVPDWPRLAWLAVCDPSSREVTCFVGDHVETADDWVCEGVWAGAALDGAFDETDVVFGSGVRIRGDRVVFVPPGTVIDRLHSMERDGRLHVSNSLVCLLSYTGGSLCLDFSRYREVFASLGEGLGRYERDLPTTVGTVRLNYFHNLEWDGAGLREVDKPFGDRRFSTFAEYRGFLASSVEALVVNARSGDRRHPFGLVASLSSGYDSSAVAVLAHEAGLTEAFGFDCSTSGDDDSGARLAEALGLRFHSFRTAEAPKADVLFLATGTGGGGDTLFASAEAVFTGRLLFTGHWGDAVFGIMDLPEGIYNRLDLTGADLCEYRLVTGTAVCAVPFLGGRQLADIRAIAESSEMAPWSVDRRYNRPIARRIVEEAGVPRDAFGNDKRGTFGPPPGPKAFLTPDLRRDYARWARVRWRDWLRARTIPPSRVWDAVTVAAGRFGPFDVPPGRRRRLHKYVTHWAVDRAKERYPKPRQRLW